MTILKENLPFLELTNVNEWNEKSYNGSIIHIVIFDEKCSPHNFVRNTVAPFCSEKIFSHAGNCASTINQFSEAKITMLYNNQENRDYFREIADTVDIVSISMSANKELAENNWDFLEQYDIPIFASSGNDGDDELNYPSAFDWVISVGAVSNGNILDYSNYDDKLDCVGITKVNILNSKGKIFQFGGTSCSNPMVASTISHYAHFVKANYNRKLGRKETFEFVHNNCIDTKETEKDGYGLFVLPNVPTIKKEPEITTPEQPTKEEIPLPTQTTKILNHVLSTPYLKLEDAQAKADELKAKGVTTYLVHSLQFNAFGSEQNAVNQQKKLFNEEGIVTYIAKY